MTKHIFLDMDGVLCDFVTPSLTWHNRLDLLENWTPGVFDIPSLLGMSKQEFWGPLAAQGSHFWSGFDQYEWMHDLVALVQSHARWSILTSPSLAASCASGKVEWLQERFGVGFRDYIITPQKHLLARPDRVLIDDSDAKIDRFRKAGGQAIVFPQIWNSAWEKVDDPLSYVRDELSRIAADS